METQKLTPSQFQQYLLAMACINTHRNYICIEKEQKYVDIGNKRILTAQPQLF